MNWKTACGGLPALPLRACLLSPDVSRNDRRLEQGIRPLMRTDALLQQQLRQRSCSERRIGLHQTMPCLACIPAGNDVDDRNVDKIYPTPARPVPGTEYGDPYVPAVGRQREGCVFEDFFNLSCCQSRVLLEHQRGYSRHVRGCRAGSKEPGVVHHSATAPKWPRNGNQEAGRENIKVLSGKFPVQPSRLPPQKSRARTDQESAYLRPPHCQRRPRRQHHWRSHSQ